MQLIKMFGSIISVLDNDGDYFLNEQFVFIVCDKDKLNCKIEPNSPTEPITRVYLELTFFDTEITGTRPKDIHPFRPVWSCTATSGKRVSE